MKDSFFVSKRAKKPALSNPTARKPKRSLPPASRNPTSKRSKSAENDSGNDDNSDAGLPGIDDMDLVGDRDKHLTTVDSDDAEDEAETAAAKRLRLAKLYLNKIRSETQDEGRVQREISAETGAAVDAASVPIGDFDAEDIDRDLIAHRLRDEVLSSKGKLYVRLASKLVGVDFSKESGRVRALGNGGKLKGHRLSLTCVDAVTDSGIAGAGGAYIYTSSKDARILKWDLQSGKPVHVFEPTRKRTKRAIKAFGESKWTNSTGHADQVLALAVSADGKYLASGGRDKAIHIWSIPNNSHLSAFKQHRDTVSSLSFRRSLPSSTVASTTTSTPNQLYSASHDRTIKLWNVDDLSYIETLFGHQDVIESVDALAGDRCVSAGSRDLTVRMWKIVEESQLIFRGGGGAGTDDVGRLVAEGIVLATEVEEVKKQAKRAGESKFGGSVDVVGMLDEEHFVSGTDNGAISLWSTSRKKPIYTRPFAHGQPNPPEPHPTDLSVPASCHWITAIATLSYSDLFASGSCDGVVRLWRVAGDKKSFDCVAQVEGIPGFVNGMKFFEVPEMGSRKEGEDDGVVDGDEEKSVGARKRDKVRKEAAELEAMGGAQKGLYLAVATGQEHRLGRWWHLEGVKNQLVVVRLM